MHKEYKALIIGDIHGCVKELENLLEKSDYKKYEKLIFVGDLINKGPYSFEVLSLVEKLNAEIVLGNHEAKFLRYLKDEVKGNFILKDLKKKMGHRLSFWTEWLNSLPLYIERKKYFVVHAGLAPGLHPKDTAPHTLLNIRTWGDNGNDLQNPKNPAWFDLYDDEKLVIHGHWAVRGLHQKENVIGIDSGCVYGKKLSAVALHSREIIQVKALKTYLDIETDKHNFTL